MVLGELFAPKREDENVQSAIARYKVGRKVQFCLLNGLRHSEMNLIPKTGINWDARQVRIRQGKTGNYKVIGPLGPTSMEILREFYDASKTDLVFSRSGNITPKFYRILREACERAGVPVPLIFQVEEASEERPYLGFQLDFEPALVASVIMESGIRIKKGDASTRAMNVSSVDADLLDAVVRLVRLVETPAVRKVLAPLIIREIIYRLLIGGQGARLSHILASGGDTRRISKAIGHLRKHFDEPLKMEEIARELGMSVSGFHHHFKSVTSMSPLQFQKHLRLQEARRLMLGEDMDAASAGFRVGYQDPSHFSREYKRHFGAPPQGDIASLRNRLEV